MLDWGLEEAVNRIGDRMTFTEIDGEQYQRWRTTTYVPMPPEDRALEQKYGYIPRLHAGNWDATVLDVLQGRKPDFPAGAPPTEAMYAVPPPKREPIGSYY